MFPGAVEPNNDRKYYKILFLMGCEMQSLYTLLVRQMSAVLKFHVASDSPIYLFLILLFIRFIYLSFFCPVFKVRVQDTTVTMNQAIVIHTSHYNYIFEGSRPEWCISSMIYSRDTPFWPGTLDLVGITLHQSMHRCSFTMDRGKDEQAMAPDLSHVEPEV